MQTSNVYEWIKKEEHRTTVLASLTQPLTAKQLSRKTRIGIDTCSHVVGRFAEHGLAVCLNPAARSSRLYGLTDRGRKCRERICRELGLLEKPEACELPTVDWALYGWLCFSHRAAIMRILSEPMQPSAMKRRLRNVNSSVKISANNIRDVIRLFLQKEIVQKIFIRKKAHPRYELTELGRKLQGLLIRAEVPL